MKNESSSLHPSILPPELMQVLGGPVREQGHLSLPSIPSIQIGTVPTGLPSSTADLGWSKPPCSQCRGPGFDPWSGNWIPHAAGRETHAAAKTWQSQRSKHLEKEKKQSPSSRLSQQRRHFWLALTTHLAGHTWPLCLSNKAACPGLSNLVVPDAGSQAARGRGGLRSHPGPGLLQQQQQGSLPRQPSGGLGLAEAGALPSVRKMGRKSGQSLGLAHSPKGHTDVFVVGARAKPCHGEPCDGF